MLARVNTLAFFIFTKRPSQDASYRSGKIYNKK